MRSEPVMRHKEEGFAGSFADGADRRSTGNPVREDIFATPALSWDGSRPLRLLVLGGSLGAMPLNKLLPAALAKIDPAQRPQVVHQCGKQHLLLARGPFAGLTPRSRRERRAGADRGYHLRDISIRTGITE